MTLSSMSDFNSLCKTLGQCEQAKKASSSEIAHERIAWPTASCEAETIDLFSLNDLFSQYISSYDVITR